MERVLASVEVIKDIKPIEGADKICSYKVKGWNVVDSIDKYKIGDFVVYCEVDSFIPNTVAPFLSKDKEPKEYNGIKGERLRTIKLRGTISQGLLLPIDILNGHMDYEDYIHLKVGDNVTENLGIQKYEPQIPACLSGVAKGVFPSFIPKTDAERCISGNIMITTEFGKKTIREIVENKLNIKVLTFNHETFELEFKPIINWSEMSNRNNWVKIKTKNGKELICTSNHKIWCNDILAYRNANDIKTGQKIIIKTD